MTYSSTASKIIVGEYKRHVQRILVQLGKVGQEVPPSGGEDASKLPPSSGQDESIDPPKPRVDPPGGMPAGGGITELDLKQRLDQAFNPSSKVDMQTPKNTPAAVYHTASSYMQPSCQGSAADIPWLPQEAADWLYNATRYAIPLLQTLLGTHKAFNSKGYYLNQSNTPARE